LGNADRRDVLGRGRRAATKTTGENLRCLTAHCWQKNGLTGYVVLENTGGPAMKTLTKIICATLLSLPAPAAAQAFYFSLGGTITSSQINDSGAPSSYNFDGIPMVSDIVMYGGGGYVFGSYGAGVVGPNFVFNGSGASDDSNPFDFATFTHIGNVETLSIIPDLTSTGSWAIFSLILNIPPINNPHGLVTGTGSYHFFYNGGGTAGGDLDGYLNFTVAGSMSGDVPEPQIWVTLIGGMFAAGGAVRRRQSPAIKSIANASLTVPA
jgi:hypothetical protein